MFIMTTRTMLVFGKKGWDMEKRYKEIKIGKIHFLRLSGKWINSSGVSSQKLSYVYEAPAGALISAKLTFLEISDMPIWEKVSIFLYLGIFQTTPTTATTTRRRFFHLARALAHSGQGWNILFGNPSLRLTTWWSTCRMLNCQEYFQLSMTLYSCETDMELMTVHRNDSVSCIVVLAVLMSFGP